MSEVDVAHLRLLTSRLTWSWMEYRTIEAALPHLLDRLEAAEARADSLADTWHADSALLARLEAAARAVVRASFQRRSGTVICIHCHCGVGHDHATDCPVGALDALLEDE